MNTASVFFAQARAKSVFPIDDDDSDSSDDDGNNTDDDNIDTDEHTEIHNLIVNDNGCNLVFKISLTDYHHYSIIDSVVWYESYLCREDRTTTHPWGL